MQVLNRPDDVQKQVIGVDVKRLGELNAMVDSGAKFSAIRAELL